jgi:C1A family cysteine protease
VGWNPEGFILRNSWGYDYGQGGYINYNYNDVNLIYEAWTLIK